jgi:hypothetical protein
MFFAGIKCGRATSYLIFPEKRQLAVAVTYREEGLL